MREARDRGGTERIGDKSEGGQWIEEGLSRILSQTGNINVDQHSFFAKNFKCYSLLKWGKKLWIFKCLNKTNAFLSKYVIEMI